MKWGLIMLLLLPSPAADDDFTYRLGDFHRKYISFLLEYEGCPPHVQTNSAGIPQDCVNAGSFDLKKFNASKRAAERLFGLMPVP